MLGFSLGTTVLQYSMAEMPEFHEKYTNVVGLVAPCGVMDIRQTEAIFNKEYFDFLNENSVLAINGPGWDEDLVKICAYSQVLCDYVAYYTQPTMDAVPIKMLMLYAQNAEQYRPQLWIDDYFD